MPTWKSVLCVTSWFVLVAIIINAWRDVPLIDDWTYAWTVEQFLHTGQLRILDWSSAYPVLPAIWGAAWSALLGFSFASLRVSTLVLAAGGCVALYLMLRELDVSPRLALLGSLSLAMNPAFVFLSSSFMTDVPFAALTTMALLCFVRAAKHDQPSSLWWACGFAFATFLVRQVGILTPVAGLPLLFLRPNRSTMSRWHVALGLGVTWIAIGVTWAVLRQSLGTTSIMQRWTWNLLAQPDSYLAMNLPLFLLIAFYLLPVLLAAASLHDLWRRPLRLGAGLAVVAAALFAVLGQVPQPLEGEHTWSTYELGISRLLVAGNLSQVDPAWIAVLLRGTGLLAGALLLLLAFAHRGAVQTAWVATRSALTRVRLDVQSLSGFNARPRPADGGDVAWAMTRAPLIAYFAGHLVIINLLWMYHDRYNVAILPVIIALVLATAGRRTASLAIPSVVLAAFAVTSLIGTRDALRFNEAVRDTRESLLEAGVAPSDIDAGYVWNGWGLYAHPSNLASGMTALKDVPWISSVRRSSYVISRAPLDGYTVEREVMWSDVLWRVPERLLVLKEITPSRSAAAP